MFLRENVWERKRKMHERDLRWTCLAALSKRSRRSLYFYITLSLPSYLPSRIVKLNEDWKEGREREGSTHGANDSFMHHVFKDRHQSVKSFNCFQGSLWVPSSFFFPFSCSLSLFSSPSFLTIHLLRYAGAKLLFNLSGTFSYYIAIKEERIRVFQSIVERVISISFAYLEKNDLS